MRSDDECKAMNIFTRAYVDHIGGQPVEAGFGFLMDITRFDGQTFTMAVKDATRCMNLITDLVPNYLMIECIEGEDAAVAPLREFVRTPSVTLH